MKFSERYSTNHYPNDPIKSAVWDYVAGYTTGVNDKLRRGLYSRVKDVCMLLDAAFTEKKKLNVWRTVDIEYIENTCGVNFNDAESVRAFIDLKPRLINKGYMSTASIMKSPWGSKWHDYEILLHITSDFPYPCIDINKMFRADEIDCADQHEILLPRDTMLKVTGCACTKGSRLWVLQAEVVNTLNEKYVAQNFRSGDIMCVDDLHDHKIISDSDCNDIKAMIDEFKREFEKFAAENEVSCEESQRMLHCDLPYLVDTYELNVDLMPYLTAFDEVQEIINLDIERIVYNSGIVCDVQQNEDDDYDIW